MRRSTKRLRITATTSIVILLSASLLYLFVFLNEKARRVHGSTHVPCDGNESVDPNPAW